MTDYQGNIIIKNPATPTGPEQTGMAPGIWKLSEAMAFKRQGIWPTQGIVGADAYFHYVTMLLSTTSLNNAQNNTFIDSSTNNFTITRNGNTTQGSFTPYGASWSNYFDGSGDYLSVPSNTAFAFSTGDFTIEFWIYVTANSGDWFPISSIGSGGFFFGQRAGSGWGYGSTGNFWSYNTGVNPVLNTWQHIAISRSGTSLRIFADGVQIGTTRTDSSDWSLATGGTSIGSQGANYYTTGYISNMRVLKGTGLYTANFTVPTAPLTAISGTSLLICQSNRFRDASTNNFTITRNGDVKVTNFAPFAPTAAYSTSTNGGSAYFDGTGDNLTTPSNTAFAFGTGDFAIECWAFRGNTDYFAIFESRGGSAGLLLYVDAANQYLRIYDQNTGFHPSSTITVPLGQWVHLAATRSSGTLYFWINGQAAGSTSYTTNIGSTATLRFFGSNDSQPNLGYASNFRVVKGSAVYTSAFTPPTSPVTAITNTSALLNFTNAAIFDNSMKNDLETVGDAKVSTVVSKFGGSSMAFDGTGDYLSVPNNAELQFGTGNFTVECWVNSSVSSGTSYNTVIGKWGASFNTTGDWSFRTRFNTDQVAFTLRYSSGWYDIQSSTSINDGAWHHIAVARDSSTTIKLFVDGVLKATQAVSASDIVGSSATMSIGGNAASAGSESAFNGYVDDVRITKGYARYTSNFTPPTETFPIR